MRYFTWKLELVSNILWMVLAKYAKFNSKLFWEECNVEQVIIQVMCNKFNFSEWDVEAETETTNFADFVVWYMSWSIFRDWCNLTITPYICMYLFFIIMFSICHFCQDEYWEINLVASY